MKKKIIYFLSPKNKGGTYFYYKEISEYLIQNYSDVYEVKFCNSLLAYIKLHFIKSDIIFSIIPFIFKPLFTKKYIFNLHGNFKIERKNRGLGTKLLYFAELNLGFSDKIMLTSYYLADKLYFRKKYNEKIILLPNFINEKDYNFGEKKYYKNIFKILTITSFKFIDKGKGVLNLAKVISKIGNKTNKNIVWTIIGNDNSENFLKIKKEFDKNIFSDNIEIFWKGWCNKNEIKKELKKNDYFLYWTYLDNFPGVILEAIVSNLKVFVNNFESFKYFLNDKIICKNEEDMLNKIIKNANYEISIEKFYKNNILQKIIKCIELE